MVMIGMVMIGMGIGISELLIETQQSISTLYPNPTLSYNETRPALLHQFGKRSRTAFLSLDRSLEFNASSSFTAQSSDELLTSHLSFPRSVKLQ